MIFKKLIVPIFIIYTVLVFLLAYVFQNDIKGLDSGIQLATYYATGLALFYGIFTLALMSIEYEIREIENRLNKFYRPADNFFENIKNREFRLEDSDRNRIKKLGWYKYLAKKRTKDMFKIVENLFLQNIPIDKNNNDIKKFLCYLILDISFYEKRLEECEELLHKFD